MCKAKFRRQYPIGGFVLDFYCAGRKLGIEIDGGVHINRREHDEARQNIVEGKGIKILRFKNDEVTGNIEEVLKKIKRSIVPSPQSGEGCPDRSVGAG